MVLRSYLNAWLPIMGMRNGRIIFVDGFAGPGEYEGGEEGSPIIALKALIDHASRQKISAEVVYLFVEGDKKRADHLEGLVEQLRPQLPSGCKVQVEHGKFDATLTDILDAAGATGKNLAPAFVMVDPFGVKETPMSVLARILENPKSELYVSFMYEAINRFKDSPEFEQHLDSLFGTPAWRIGIAMPESKSRRSYFYELYAAQLKKAGAKYVVWFELYNGNRHVYTIFFATQHHVGCNRMKEAIWRVAPMGEYEFRGLESGQMSLTQWFEASRDPLRRQLRERFAGDEKVTIEFLKQWISGDDSFFHLGHLKSTLKEMELAGEVRTSSTNPRPRRKGTFPDGILVEFVAPTI
jgi:three-Cys-motif partner protein